MVYETDDTRRVDSRRTFLKAAGGTAAAVGLAGCTGIIGGGGGGEFPNRDITWMVPYGTGGAFDVYARAFAEFMPEYLPTDVNVVVENVTGAGGRKAMGELMNADPDGYTIGAINFPGFVAQQIAVGDSIEYDLTELTYVARYWSHPYVMLTRPDSPYQTIEDMQNASEPVTFASTGGGTSTLVFALAVSVMDIPNEEVAGYNGSSESVTALLRGDVDARVHNVYDGIVSLINDGEVNVVAGLGQSLPAFAGDAPTAVDLGYENLANNAQSVGLQAAPPETPDDRLDVLEQAFLDAMASDEMQSWAEENNRPMSPANREEVAGMIDSAFETFDEYKDIYVDLYT